MQDEDPMTEQGISFAKEVADLTIKHRNEGLPFHEMIAILLHLTRLHACLKFEDYYHMCGFLTSCLQEGLEELYDKTKKVKEEKECTQSPALTAETTSCGEV